MSQLASLTLLVESGLKGYYISANILSAVAGAQFVLCVYGLVVFLSRPSGFRKAKRKQLMISFFLLVLFVFVAIARSHWAELQMTQYRVSRRLDLSDPLPWLTVADQIASGAIHATGEAVFLFRCYILWYDRRWVLAFPVTLYVATTSVGIAAIIVSLTMTSPDPTMTKLDMRLFLSYYTLSVATNVCMTCLIAAPLVKMRMKFKAVRKSFKVPRPVNGSPTTFTPQLEVVHAPKQYTSVLSILIESALPFALVGLSLAVSTCVLLDPPPSMVESDSAKAAYLLSIPIQNAVWISTCAIAPQLIIFRVTIGETWTVNPSTTRTRGRVQSPLDFGGAATRTGLSDCEGESGSED